MCYTTKMWHTYLENWLQEELIHAPSLAKVLGVSRSYMYYIISGAKPAPSVPKLIAMIRFLVAQPQLDQTQVKKMIGLLIDDRKKRHQIDVLEAEAQAHFDSPRGPQHGLQLDMLDQTILSYFKDASPKQKKAIIGLIRSSL